MSEWKLWLDYALHFISSDYSITVSEWKLWPGCSTKRFNVDYSISKDLVHWKELPIALFPDQHGAMFTGSAVIDWNNTAELQSGEEKTMIAFFTAAGKPFTQGMAYSNDRGCSWKKYKKNPVLPAVTKRSFDPRVIWYPPENKWIMALYLDRVGLPTPDLPKAELAELYKERREDDIIKYSKTLLNHKKEHLVTLSNRS